jgi:hypothetical protein
MTDEIPNGIRIGDDKWILWVDYDPTKEMSGDLLLAPLRDLWNQLETNCVADCCGLDAFDFTPENIQRASAKLADPALSQKLATLRQQLAESKEIAYDNTRWNCSLHRDVLIQLVDHITRCANVA